MFLILTAGAAFELSSSLHGTTALSTLIRSKRQILYLCGRYPQQYYSNYREYLKLKNDSNSQTELLLLMLLKPVILQVTLCVIMAGGR